MTVSIIEQNELRSVATLNKVIAIRESIVAKDETRKKVLVFEDSESFECARSLLCDKKIAHSALYATNSLLLFANRIMVYEV